MTTVCIATLLVFSSVTIINEGSTAIKNCCNIAVKDQYFSINKNFSGVYTIIDLCWQRTIYSTGLLWHCHWWWRLAGYSEEERWLWRFFIGSMRWDLVLWLGNFGTSFMPSIVSSIQDSGTYVLTTSSLMEQMVICNIVTLE